MGWQTFCKGPSSKYFRLCGPWFCVNDSSLLLQSKSSHRQLVNIAVFQYNFFTRVDSRMQVILKEIGGGGTTGITREHILPLMLYIVMCSSFFDNQTVCVWKCSRLSWYRNALMPPF